MNVELIRVHTEDSVDLEGMLRQPASGVTSRLPIDAVIMHHGVGGNFYRQYFLDEMTDAFLAQGCSVLRVNNRGHDLVYAGAYTKNPEFYTFTRSLSAYRKSFADKGDVILVDPDSEFFRYLDQSNLK